MILVSIVVQGICKRTVDMPLLRSRSAVIAAACQPKGDNPPNEAQLKEVQQGVMCEPLESNISEIRYCLCVLSWVRRSACGREDVCWATFVYHNSQHIFSNLCLILRSFSIEFLLNHLYYFRVPQTKGC
jgi:hypothetical protein